MVAPVALRGSYTVSSWPYFIQRLLVTGGTIAKSIPHGGPSNPEGPAIVNYTNLSSGAGVASMACTARDGTNITLDFRANAGDTVEIICIWTSSATGGTS